MKSYINRTLKAKLITIVASLLFAACEAAPPANQSANLPQNTNSADSNNLQATPNVIETLPAPEQTISPAPEATIFPTIEQPANNAPNANSPITPDGKTSNGNSANGNYNLVAVEKLIIPVAGIKREQLQDTFKDAR